MKYLTKTIWLLSLISLFTDTASEMLYPVMPIYLKSIGFSVVFIGILEGLAEAVAGLSKGYFGKLSDFKGKRAPFVQFGYGLSALSKPLMAVWAQPVWVFFSRTLDRVGKGIRTGARDAMLSGETTAENKGKVFGFHRAMDTCGAVLGPSLALLFLYFYPGQYRLMFLIAVIPGILSILVSFLLKDKNIHPNPSKKPDGIFSFVSYWKESPLIYKKVVLGVLLFTLFNSSDMFLLLRLKDTGLNDTSVIGTYIFYNLVYAIASFPLGALGDKIGLKTVLIIGLVLFAIVYFGMGIGGNLVFYLAMFFIYGLYVASTEGVIKAYVSNMIPKTETASAIGTFTGFQSIAALLASTFAGLIWYNFSPEWVFYSGGIFAVITVLYFAIFIRSKR